MRVGGGLDGDKVGESDGMIEGEVKGIEGGEFSEEMFDGIKRRLIKDYLSEED